MITIIFIGIGAALGASLRSYISTRPKLQSFGFPLGTLIINSVGSFLMGVIIIFLSTGGTLYSIIVTGFLGGFTTYSSFTLDQLKLYEQRRYKAFIAYSLLMFTVPSLALLLGLYVSSPS
ncbi:fluoride efflux transporter CrcB [Salinicoccus jeotgali]|uniref:Fluoride-specific ion channel FluC n=1 Tax=Salinicoccus jeotgali TaxID=381634 RepID=A0ABP7ETY5_9STAP